MKCNNVEIDFQNFLEKIDDHSMLFLSSAELLSDLDKVVELIWSTASDIVLATTPQNCFTNYLKQVLSEQNEISELVAQSMTVLGVSKKVEDVIRSKGDSVLELTDEEFRELVEVLNLLIVGKVRRKK